MMNYWAGGVSVYRDSKVSKSGALISIITTFHVIKHTVGVPLMYDISGVSQVSDRLYVSVTVVAPGLHA